EFTLNILQAEGYNGPFSHSFDGVKMEKKSELEFSFVLPETNSNFPSILSEIGVLPAHKLKEVEPKLLDKSDFNLNPIGSGRYRLETKKDKSNSIILKRADTYKKDNEGFFEQVIFRSYQSQGELVEAYKKGEINGFGGFTPLDLASVDRKTFRCYRLQIPRFTAVFFNLDKNINQELKFRQALSQAIDKEKIVQEVYGGGAEILKTVIPSFAPGYDAQTLDYPYNPEMSRLYLSQLKNTNPELVLYTIDDSSLQKIAELVVEDWAAVGVKAKIIVVDLLTLQKTIIPLRQYDAVILGENLDSPPDPYPYFHSSQINGGLNISAYKNLAADSLLEDARLSIDPQVRTDKLKSFSKIIAEDLPVIPLMSAPYLYGANISIKGIIKTRIAGNSSDRFIEIGEWYIKSERKRK
ncbi:ABC transporter substrate-binding protein, partial [Patescibacteria group bacterium]|nr:ABC transporter substrate-binding protein [Patescibacteria group bacterium]